MTGKREYTLTVEVGENVRRYLRYTGRVSDEVLGERNAQMAALGADSEEYAEWLARFARRHLTEISVSGSEDVDGPEYGVITDEVDEDSGPREPTSEEKAERLRALLVGIGVRSNVIDATERGEYTGGV